LRQPTPGSACGHAVGARSSPTSRSRLRSSLQQLQRVRRSQQR
jgi:hypothetical protein